jgi:methyl-accepting chemotaxis protein
MSPDESRLRETVAVVQTSWASVMPLASEIATLFYQNLFALEPTLRPLFKGDMREQGSRLVAMLDLVVGKLGNIDVLEPELHQLGRRHAQYGVTETHYDLVGIALLQTLEQGLGSGFTREVRAAWTVVYTLVATVMMEAAKRPAASATQVA